MSIHKPSAHDSAPLHVAGSARYVDDIPLPANALHLAFGLSPIARGTVRFDLTKVRETPGVVVALSAAETGAVDVSPSAHDEPLLAEMKDGAARVHYMGQPLFVVAATSHLAARKAARQAAMETAEDTPILTIDEALAADSRFEDGPVTWTKGDADAALSAAPHRLQGSIEIGGQEHFYLEGQAALAIPGEGGDMVVHSSSQHPTEIQHKVAEALGVPMHTVRVEVRRMGGGFGGKESQGNALAVACALVAARTGRPVKMRYDRDDDMTITGKRHDIRIGYDVGHDDEGRITGIVFDHYVRCGWSQDLSLPVADRAMLHADNAYHLTDVRIVSHRLKTNTQSATAFRGFGGPQGVVGIERVLDEIAHRLGRDPLDVRRVNFYAAGHSADTSGTIPPQATGKGHVGTEDVNPGTDADVTSRGALHEVAEPAGPVAAPPDGVQTTPYHMPVRDFILHEMVDALEDTADYRARRAAIEAWNAAHPYVKKGIALTPVKFGISFTLTHLNQAGALVHVYQDGSVHMNHGGTEMGQGLHQKVAAVAADRFGVPLSAIRITATDTGKVPNTSATAASSGADLNGMAVKAACDEIAGRMAAFLAEQHQADPADVRFQEGRVHVGSESYAFTEAVQLAYQGRVSLSATGYYRTPGIEWDRLRGRGTPFFYFAHGAAVTEVVLDTRTGENRILRTDILHDCGKSLNPAIDIGQIEGGYVQGAGWLTTEELVWDDKGRLTTHAPSTYKIPACSDRPEVFDVALWHDENRAETIYRSKAVGEPPFMLGVSAFLALSHAASACGAAYPDLDAPATAERLFFAARHAQGA
ncbi:xanthine dehydrogenase molybdopterin binding subunit [Palleronia sp.]|uniref:xanthine dehydrogenase molybdopterin binding subunit n=1 Tax=Palleronia sp. TaxID=1940284 RepID=UPI0035C79BA1